MMGGNSAKMREEFNRDLAAFEEYLFSFMTESTASTPLTNDEVIAILQNYGPPEKPSAEEKEQLVRRMKETHERLMESILKRLHL
jgi:hypothetical protein